jgi:hypothetical protein
MELLRVIALVPCMRLPCSFLNIMAAETKYRIISLTLYAYEIKNYLTHER